MNVAIYGAGNIGTQFAVHCAEKGHNVTVFTSKPGKIQNNLRIVNENRNVIHQGTIKKATSNSREAFENAELIFVVVPAFMMDEAAGKILPYANENQMVCIVPGTGGGECAFKKCVEKGVVLFGLQRVPSVARLTEYGKEVQAVGYRPLLHIAAIPANQAQRCAEIIKSIFDIECVALPNYLNVTLTPSNPILHTTRLRTLYQDYKKGIFYKEVPLFYEDWTDETSKLMLKCDEEVQKICHALSELDLSYVKSLKEHYESDTVEKMTNKIRSIKGFKGLTSPATLTEKGYIPDFESRYFKADFSYGLSIIVQISKLLNLETPNIIETLEWYNLVSDDKNCFSYAKYEINNITDFIKFYSK